MYVTQHVTVVDSWSVSHPGRSEEARTTCASSYHAQGVREPGELYIKSHQSTIEGCFQWVEKVLSTMIRQLELRLA